MARNTHNTLSYKRLWLFLNGKVEIELFIVVFLLLFCLFACFVVVVVAVVKRRLRRSEAVRVTTQNCSLVK